MPDFRTLLVANRSEIARRIIRSAHAIGLRTVAVYAEPDRHEPHVAEADVAIALGGTTASETYLDIDAIVAAAAATGAEAIHPGYGFLSENAAAAQRATDAGLVWIGPPPAVIGAMGDKLRAKRLAAEVGVPLLPGTELAGDDDLEWQPQAASVGYPLLVKAASGGGGKGMRLVESEDDLAHAVRTARREASASFGDATVFAERYLRGPRHVEIQVVADAHGNVLHLGERECSIQRRHQKILEEAPSPAVGPALRARLGHASVELARAIGYVSLGTVEFLLDDVSDEFYFLEMNTRLQVEHPVTEAVTGLDLVELQFDIARGRPLPFAQDEIAIFGHAIEARLYAEDPSRDWHPSTGTVHRYREPLDEAVRFDSGIATGSKVTPHFDPMLAKVIAHSAERADAAGRLARGLLGLELHGITTNRDYLIAVLEDADFLAGETSTSFVETHPVLLDARAGPATRNAHAVAALLVEARRRQGADSHWGFAPRGWRNVPGEPRAVELSDLEGVMSVAYDLTAPPRFSLTIDGNPFEGRILSNDGEIVHFELGGLAIRCSVQLVGATAYVNSAAGQTVLTEVARFVSHDPDEAGAGPTAPLPGRVVAVEVTAGDRVTAGDVLVVLEAMKVEHRITAATDGVVATVLVDVGSNVEAHEALVRFEETT